MQRIAIFIFLMAGLCAAEDFTILARQYFRVQISPNGLALDARLLAPDGTELTSAVNEAGEQQPVSLSAVAPVDAVYHLDVRLTDPNAPSRRYEVALAEVRASKPEDETRVNAMKTFQQGKRLELEGSKTSL